MSKERETLLSQPHHSSLITPHSITIPGYEILEELSHDEWFVLYRARRVQDGVPVLCKTPHHEATAATALEREYTLLHNLSVPGVVRVHDILHFDEGACLVLEDHGAVPLQSLLTDHPFDLSTFFPLALQVTTILDALHQRDIIHQHLTPLSIFLHPVTHAVSLTGFGLAVRTPGETHPLLPAFLVPSVLPYLSPEQTGRMNRAVDYRTDFYALGIVFYQLLTGHCPFVSDDALELIHWHIAKFPPSPTAVNPSLPEQVSRIILQLLAKTADERYQSASGVQVDLQQCAQQWAERGEILSFPLCQQDVSARFLIPQHLYGREPQLAALLDAFTQTCAGRSALMLVAGYSGIGKTTLIQELYKPLVRQRGYFIVGKFNQLERNIPYRALLQAFQRLVQRLLAEGEDRLHYWRAQLATALGVNGGVLAEVLPEIELIIGKQPPVAPLGPLEAQRRFTAVVQNFLAVLATPEHPLVVFLDDLQWADAATLPLLLPLLTSPMIRCLFVIGAYRDNEVSTDHPLMGTKTALEGAGALVHHLTLPPLAVEDLTSLIRDSLRSSLSDARPLAALLKRKTDGNPFFVIQFLKALHGEGLIVFDDRQRRWTYDITAIAQTSITDNVVDLMSRKIRQLTPDTQRALTLAACVGNRFDVHTLAIISERTAESAAADLQQALDEGLILPVSEPAMATPTTYAFLHDRVQQAAYAQIPEAQKPLVHLRVGRLLLEQWDRTAADEHGFAIASHLNFGSALISDEAERLALARLNLTVGQRAKSSTAYQAAWTYLNAGIGLLTEGQWESEYELLFALHIGSAECAYLCGDFPEAERLFDFVLSQARTRLDKAKVYALQILQYEHRSRYADAMRAGRDGLALFGLSFPDSVAEQQRALNDELAAIQSLIGDRPIDSLIDLPALEDAEMRMVMKLRTNLHTSCFLSGDKPLTLLNISAMIRLSLTYGNIAESAYAYVLHAAMLLGPIKEDYRSAYEFGLLALRLNERLPNPALRAKVCMMFAWSVSLWRKPLEASFPYTQEAFRLGNDTGLFVDASWALFNEIWFALLTSDNLANVQDSYAAHVEYSRRIKMDHIADAKQVLLQWGLALQGRTEGPCSLTSATFDEEAYRTTYQGQRLFEMFFISAKLALLYTFDEYSAAHEAAYAADTIIRADFTGTIWDALRTFHHALTLAALHRTAAADERRHIADQLGTLATRLQRWAEHSPRNFQAQHLMVAAERARLRGDDADALRLYEDAIDVAVTHQRAREIALANELYAKFWLGRGNERIAAVYLNEASRCYAGWGAAAKVQALAEKYPHLLAMADGEAQETSVRSESAPTARVDGAAPVSLDLSAISKAAGAIAGELVLERLLRKLIHIILEDAGAQRGLFLQEQDGRLLIMAEGSIDNDDVHVLQAVPLEHSPQLSHAIVQYVRATGESVVLADACIDERFSNDPYVLSARPRSLLCLPVMQQGTLEGILYLENNLTTEVFTTERVTIMYILASGTAVSLENARLYDEMKQEVKRRREAEEELRGALGEVETLKNRLQAENVYLQEEIQQEHNFEEMVGSSPPLRAVQNAIERVAPTDATVLIWGETGTGKELIARAVHNRSQRKDRPLVKVNCGAIATGLVESELFGHVRGAFTGAIDKRVGRFELADGGTLFLDEVGELPLDTQVKLLRVLQEGECEPVGSNRTVRVDVRIIAATNRDLEEAVRAGRFRADLFYRLNVFPLTVPPLRDRHADIPQLAMFFVAGFGRKFGKTLSTISHETMERLVRYPWPGNIRELQNVIERAVVLAQGSILTSDHVFIQVPAQGPGATAEREKQGVNQLQGSGFGVRSSGPEDILALQEVEKRHILAVLKQTAGVIEGSKGAAKILNLHPNTLRSRMKKLGIKRAGRE